ncbi:MAG: glycosyltransferase family A protein [Moheibacter sp.]
MTPKVSIITPTYNRADTLHRVYNSLCTQELKDIVWVVMDDGSTDETEELIRQYKDENKIEIQYFKDTNKHKFLTVFEGVKKVTTPYFVIWDSDDAYPSDSLKILYNEISKLPLNGEFIAVMGLSMDIEGEIVGDSYPMDVYDGFILDIRYKYKVRGDKNGIFITDIYHKVLNQINTKRFRKGVYIPYSVFYNKYDALGYKTRFINKIIRVYHKDDNDTASVSNTRWFGRNRYGLMEGHLSFINEYGSKLLKFPKALVRNIVGYHVYSLSQKIKFVEINRRLKHFRWLSILLFPLSFLYYKLKM